MITDPFYAEHLLAFAYQELFAEQRFHQDLGRKLEYQELKVLFRQEVDVGVLGVM